MNTTEDPATVFCIEKYDAVEEDGGVRLGRLLARLIRDPDHAVVIATANAFVFAFGEQLGRTAAAINGEIPATKMGERG